MTNYANVDSQQKRAPGKGRATPARLAGSGTRPDTGYSEWLRVPFWSRQGAGGEGVE